MTSKQRCAAVHAQLHYQCDHVEGHIGFHFFDCGTYEVRWPKNMEWYTSTIWPKGAA